jgi:poly(3-hydroxybutyrate) depolymerase
MNPAFRVLALACVAMAGGAFAATDVRVDFTLATTDDTHAPITQARTYYVYRPDGLSRATPVPMVLHMAAGAGDIASFLHRKADQAGFLVVSCEFTGNSDGGSWVNDNPRIAGFEDYDYISTVITRVAAAENAHDAFICGLSKGGHTAYAFACERPSYIRAACSTDEFMGLTANIPSAPVPILVMHGTLDTNVPYTMGKDSADAWRAMDSVMGATPVTTYEASPLQPGRVTQTTWRGGTNGTQVAFITIVGGAHQWATPTVATGYDASDGLWAFFSQYLTNARGAPKIASNPTNNTQLAGTAASFHVSAVGDLPLRYQWQRNGADFAGATNDWFTVSSLTSADSGATFRAVVTNAAGTATSSAATLTVNVAPASITISAPPVDKSVVAGQPATFAVTATSSGTPQYQWRKNGMNLPGATAASYTLPVALTSDSGATISVVVGSGDGTTVTSAPAALTVTPAPGAPVILTSPVRSRVLAGQTGSFAVTAWSATPMTYQWQKGSFTTVMSDIPGATSVTYTTPTTTLADHLTIFRCVVSNSAGAAVSATEMLFVTAAATKPTDITSATSAYATPGLPFAFTIVGSGGTQPLTFGASPLPPGLSVDQNSGLISGTPTVAGNYAVTMTATNSVGSMSRLLTLRVGATPVSWGQERLANLATRGLVGAGENNLIAGFVVQGTAAKRVLLRAVGPGLAKFGVPGTLVDPRLTLLDATGRALLTADDWDANGNVASVAAAVGAFALDPGSKDAAVVTTLAAGNYTLRVEGSPAAPTGVALAEVYDADPDGAPSRQINVATRGIASHDPNSLIAGFVIAGSATRSVLIRAIGAATLSAFGINGGLADPAVEVYGSSGSLVAANDDWGLSQLAPFLPQAFSSAGAFPLSTTSKDAAVLVTLPPGAYTAKVVNRDQPDGVALVEIYAAPAAP